MPIIPSLRRAAFWLLDQVKGAPVKTAYTVIKKIDEMDSSNPFIKEYQESEFCRLMKEARENTEYYANYVGKKLENFPVINKNDIRSKQNAFISKNYPKDKLFQMSTSGSTGTPFVCYQNGNKKKRVNAEIIYYSEKVGYRLGENLSYIRTVVNQIKKSKLKQFIQNQKLVHCGKLNDKGIEEILNALRNTSNSGDITLLGYGSTYTAMCNYAKAKGFSKFDGCKVRGIISGSDMLFDETRQSIGSLFDNARVVSRYSNEENGVLGQDEGINNVFVINEADYIVEITDDAGNRLPNGKLGHIVVTDLFNYAMPMIRYDTGDIGAIDIFNINGRNKKCICNFSGRKVDVISDTSGNAISPHAITNNMWSFPNIAQFQLIQKSQNEYKLVLNVSSDYSDVDKIIAVLKMQLGQDSIITVEIVDEIPVLSSGKRRYIVNEFKK